LLPFTLNTTMFIAVVSYSSKQTKLDVSE